MPRMQHMVILSVDDRAYLNGLIRRGSSSAFTQRRARVLLKTDRTRQPRLTDAGVADACEVSSRLVARARMAWCTAGRASRSRKPRVSPGRAFLLDASQEDRLVALACSAPPDGQVRWSLRLLANRVVELEIAESICHETVRQALKKTSSNRGSTTAS